MRIYVNGTHTLSANTDGDNRWKKKRILSLKYPWERRQLAWAIIPGYAGNAMALLAGPT